MTLYELRKKDVIRSSNGDNLGRADDIIFEDTRITALVLYGRPRLLGLAGRQPDLVIPWQQVAQVGNDVVMVTLEDSGQWEKPGRGKGIFGR